MRIDLHTHSTRSDGTVPVAELVAAAAATGLDVVAVTDHDTASGWDEALDAAGRHGIGLVRGMEISTQVRGSSVHLLAYLPDAEEPALAAELQRIRGGRDGRLPQMLEQLAGAGYPVTADDVAAVTAPGAVPGRPHVADALVARGMVADRDQAFAELLDTGRPGYVGRYAPATLDAVRLVAGAGGVSVLAHPGGRGGGQVLSDEVVASLADAGLGGLEADHQDHDRAARDRLRALAADLDLVVTGSSDFHGAGKKDHELGCNLTDQAELERLLDRAARSATAAGREVPAYLPPAQ
ncbi:phosphatase [Marmoricola endophyticus]|uniref:Phosphatase n=1 Tax=Marmoricola endophyticus TaxID=2040280 RepID=A0A917F0I3_9ACTN|nr:PHP domain-containing protein [Marmoricola endophyticus]GGF40170.1 phosphatase [Marmoricola endophyticus]